jgi:hypothetical protein
MTSVVGYWRLVEVRGFDTGGHPVAETRYGPEPAGILHLGEARMQAALGDGRAALPPGAARFWIAYSGPYGFDGATLVTRVEAASDPAWIGGEQPRAVRWEGEFLVLTPPLRPFGAAMQRLDLVWARIG